jgi:hypothetical protein
MLSRHAHSSRRWSCLAVAILLGDLANQWHELASARPRPLDANRAAMPLATPAE